MYICIYIRYKCDILIYMSNFKFTFSEYPPWHFTFYVFLLLTLLCFFLFFSLIFHYFLSFPLPLWCFVDVWMTLIAFYILLLFFFFCGNSCLSIGSLYDFIISICLWLCNKGYDVYMLEHHNISVLHKN